MPKAMTDLVIGEVSGVDAPAHLENGWMVWKSAGATPEQIAKVEIVEALVDAVAKAGGLDLDLLGQIGAEVLDDDARAVLKALTNPDKESTNMPDFDVSTLSEDAQAAFVALTAERDAAVAKAAAAPEPTPDEALAKALEGMPEPMRKAWTANQEALVEATAVAKNERELRLTAEYTAKAEQFDALPVEKAVLATDLRAIADVDPKLAERIEKMLAAANEAAEQAELFKAIGNGAAHVVTGSAHDQLDQLAQAAMKADPALDYATAMTKAVGEHPDLYTEHRSASSNQEG